MSDPDKKYILGLDPGDTTGLVVVDYSGKILEWENIPDDEINKQLIKFAERYNFNKAVAEDYRVYGHKAQAHQGSRVPAIKVLGALSIWAQMNKVHVTLQPANILPIARKWSKANPKGSHKDLHYMDAYNHVFYWMVRNGLAKPKGISK